ncbi:MAG: PD-(D/E)XK nuclease family protein [Phascolarctobacterium sp.]|nr:PD-(D/E)XK nuclease family protein [Phascolarctobacterium sp.]
MKTVFEIFGIENKELQVSKLLAYYFNPKYNKQYAIAFLNEFCKNCGLNKVGNDADVEVTTEKIVEDIFCGKKYKNRIDIFIKIKESDGRKRIICIENKIYSEEGYRQTERYVKAIKGICNSYDEYNFVYLTKNNSYVDLSSSEFKHIRYSMVADILSMPFFVGMPFANDFCEYYVLQEEREFKNIQINDENFTGVYIENKEFNKLIDYVVWRINNHHNNKHSKIFCKNGKSDKSPDCFYQISHQEWGNIINNKYANTLTSSMNEEGRNYTLHLEGRNKAVFLHFELHPYLPVSKIEKQYGKNFLEDYQNKQNEIAELVSHININGVTCKNIPGNASLTVGKWEINSKSFNEYFDVLVTLIDEILTKIRML